MPSTSITQPNRDERRSWERDSSEWAAKVIENKEASLAALATNWYLSGSPAVDSGVLGDLIKNGW